MRIHVFVDSENISVKDFKQGVNTLRKSNKISRIDVFAKEKPSYADAFHCNFIQCFYGKNSADTFITAAMVRSVYEEPLTDGVALFSADSDFAPAIKAVTDAKKPVIIVASYSSLKDKLRCINTDMTLVSEIGIRDKENFVQIALKMQEYDKIKHLHMTTVYLLSGKIIYEVPFANGIDIDTFSRLIPLDTIKKFYPKSWSLSKILEKNFIKQVDGKLYIDVEEIYNG